MLQSYVLFGTNKKIDGSKMDIWDIIADSSLVN
jgi:hypothetical protein